VRALDRAVLRIMHDAAHRPENGCKGRRIQHKYYCEPSDYLPHKKFLACELFSGLPGLEE
jgi:hypothetical protein